MTAAQNRTRTPPVGSQAIPDQTHYEELCQKVRHHQALIIQCVVTYFAVATPLVAGALGIADISRTLQISACGAGLAASVLWFLISERMRRYNDIYVARLKRLEGGAGLFTQDAVAKASDWFLRITPSHSRLATISTLVGLSIFTGRLMFLLMGRA